MTQRAVLLICLLVLGVNVCSAQRLGDKAPKEVVEEYWTFETGGGRLTPEGWKSASRFFVKPSPPPQRRVIVVVGREHSVEELAVKDGSAQIIVGYRDICKCNIAPDMRLVRSATYSAIKTSAVFKLVLTNGAAKPKDELGKLGEDGDTPEWKIDAYSTDSPIWLTIDAAIRYLTEVRNQSKSPAVKKNAGESLSALRHLSDGK